MEIRALRYFVEVWRMKLESLNSFFPGWVSAISQNRPVIIEIKGPKTSHFKENKTAPRDREEIGSMEHVECPRSEPANNDIQLGPARMVATANCERVGDQSRNGGSVLAAAKTGHFGRRL
jgi:hypothetical protein